MSPLQSSLLHSGFSGIPYAASCCYFLPIPALPNITWSSPTQVPSSLHLEPPSIVLLINSSWEWDATREITLFAAKEEGKRDWMERVGDGKSDFPTIPWTWAWKAAHSSCCGDGNHWFPFQN